MNHTAETARGQGTLRVEGAQMEVAVVNLPPGEGRRTLWVLGELVTYKVSSQMTGGAYATFEVATRAGAGTSPHVQHREDESFYVLEGEYEFIVESRTSRVRAGSLLYIPKGTLHAHRSVGEGVGRMLVTQTPGGLYERFFEEVGKPLDGEADPPTIEGLPDAEWIVNVAAKHGIEIPPESIAGCGRSGESDRLQIGRLHAYSPVEQRGAVPVALTHSYAYYPRRGA